MNKVYRQGRDLVIEIDLVDQRIYLENILQEVRIPKGKLIFIRSPCDSSLYKKDERGNLYEPRYSLTALVEGAEESRSPNFQVKSTYKKEGIIGLELEEAISKEEWQNYKRQIRNMTQETVSSYVTRIMEENYHYEQIYKGDDNNMRELLEEDSEYWSAYFGEDLIVELRSEGIRDGWFDP